ncbi:hypothetical protein M885DRAFT_506153 [Pelagophyceae sp. CCMP2097]|nr:hypothetical protein M885DRAFT_506153 [Pelagophyceae sp. CCMP2097]
MSRTLAQGGSSEGAARTGESTAALEGGPDGRPGSSPEAGPPAAGRRPPGRARTADPRLLAGSRGSGASSVSSDDAERRPSDRATFDVDDRAAAELTALEQALPRPARRLTAPLKRAPPSPRRSDASGPRTVGGALSATGRRSLAASESAPRLAASESAPHPSTRDAAQFAAVDGAGRKASETKASDAEAWLEAMLGAAPGDALGEVWQQRRICTLLAKPDAQKAYELPAHLRTRRAAPEAAFSKTAPELATAGFVARRLRRLDGAGRLGAAEDDVLVVFVAAAEARPMRRHRGVPLLPLDLAPRREAQRVMPLLQHAHKLVAEPVRCRDKDGLAELRALTGFWRPPRRRVALGSYGRDLFSSHRGPFGAPDRKFDALGAGFEAMKQCHFLARTTRAVSRSYAVLAVFGVGFHGRMFVETADDDVLLKRGLLFRAYVAELAVDAELVVPMANVKDICDALKAQRRAKRLLVDGTAASDDDDDDGAKNAAKNDHSDDTSQDGDAYAAGFSANMRPGRKRQCVGELLPLLYLDYAKIECWWPAAPPEGACAGPPFREAAAYRVRRTTTSDLEPFATPPNDVELGFPKPPDSPEDWQGSYTTRTEISLRISSLPRRTALDERLAARGPRLQAEKDRRDRKEAAWKARPRRFRGLAAGFVANVSGERVAVRFLEAFSFSDEAARSCVLFVTELDTSNEWRVRFSYNELLRECAAAGLAPAAGLEPAAAKQALLQLARKLLSLERGRDRAASDAALRLEEAFVGGAPRTAAAPRPPYVSRPQPPRRALRLEYDALRAGSKTCDLAPETQTRRRERPPVGAAAEPPFGALGRGRGGHNAQSRLAVITAGRTATSGGALMDASAAARLGRRKRPLRPLGGRGVYMTGGVTKTAERLVSFAVLRVSGGLNRAGTGVGAVDGVLHDDAFDLEVYDASAAASKTLRLHITDVLRFSRPHPARHAAILAGEERVAAGDAKIDEETALAWNETVRLLLGTVRLVARPAAADADGRDAALLSEPALSPQFALLVQTLRRRAALSTGEGAIESFLAQSGEPTAPLEGAARWHAWQRGASPALRRARPLVERGFVTRSKARAWVFCHCVGAFPAAGDCADERGVDELLDRSQALVRCASVDRLSAPRDLVDTRVLADFVDAHMLAAPRALAAEVDEDALRLCTRVYRSTRALTCVASQHGRAPGKVLAVVTVSMRRAALDFLVEECGTCCKFALVWSADEQHALAMQSASLSVSELKLQFDVMLEQLVIRDGDAASGEADHVSQFLEIENDVDADDLRGASEDIFAKLETEAAEKAKQRRGK